ncbi:MAG: hypothetical protein HY272_08000 [Gammaproteobacteria bacterium]|nr:hypothetical protein [Gammaproteobacteria bacterium]
MTPPPPLYLAIDQGGHASRALIFDTTGKVVAAAECAVTTYTPETDWVEHDSEEMITSIENAIHEAVTQAGARQSQIVAAGLATQRSSIVCWDKSSGRALSPIISWQDRRNAQWLAQLSLDQQSLHDLTGLFASPHYGASKIRWCLDHLAEVQRAFTQQRLVIGPMASYVIQRLTHRSAPVTDPANGSRTLLLNLAHLNWEPKLLMQFGIPLEILPHCVPSRHAFGEIEVNGLHIPLTVVTGDQSAAIFAWGKPNTNAAYANLGTGAFIQRILSQPLHHPHLLSSIVYSDQATTYALEGTVNGAGRALQWFSEQEQILNLETQLPRWLEQIDNPPLFINAVSGLAAPYWRPDLQSEFIGDADNAHKTVAVAESIIFLLQRNLEELETMLAPSREIIASGGLAQLDGLCQRLADLSQKTLLRPQAHEATAQGLAWLIAGQPSKWASLSEANRVEPRPASALQQRYHRWRATLEDRIS